MGFFKRLFDNKERCRDFVRAAYKRAFADAARGLAGNPATPHVVGLYSALANFYAFRGMQVGEMEIWPELLPFLQMKEAESVTALVEYTVFRMWPNDAVISRVRPQLNGVLRGMNAFDEEHKAALVMAYALAKSYMDTDGKSGHPITWFAMLDEDVHRQLAALVMKMDTVNSSLREAENPDDEEEGLVEEVKELLVKAEYPDDLGRYFEVLRQNRLSLKFAATRVDDSRGIFESWEFSSSTGRLSSVIVRFWHDNHTVDWESTLYDENETKEKAVGHSLTQLENVLERWAAMVDGSKERHGS